MKTKVFGIIFISFILVMVVNTTQQAIGKALEKQSTKLILEQMGFPNKMLNNPTLGITDLLQISSSPEFFKKYSETSQPIIKKYHIYSIINSVIQILLILSIALMTSKLTIETVKRNV